MTKRGNEKEKRSNSKKEILDWSSKFPGLDILRMTKRRHKLQDLRNLYFHYKEKKVDNNGDFLGQEKSINNNKMNRMAFTGSHI